MLLVSPADLSAQPRRQGPEGLGGYQDVARQLGEGADVLIHDGRYTAPGLDANHRSNR